MISCWLSTNLGVIPGGTIIPCKDIIERRVNSCGVVRFLVEYKPVGRGWISLRIRGGEEEPILELIDTNEIGGEGMEDQDVTSEPFICPFQCANVWSPPVETRWKWWGQPLMNLGWEKDSCIHLWG